MKKSNKSQKLKKNKIEVIELFAGVGGFKLGLEGDSKGKSSTSNYKNNLNSNYKVIWSNQFEPLTKTVQHASEIYKSVWPKSNHSNQNIEWGIELNNWREQLQIPLI